MKCITTANFDSWLERLRDPIGKARITARILRMEQGNFGDRKYVGDEVYELRFFFGPGYRVYYTIRGEEIIFILAGGDKSTQSQDIELAKKISKEIP